MYCCLSGGDIHTRRSTFPHYPAEQVYPTYNPRRKCSPCYCYGEQTYHKNKSKRLSDTEVKAAIDSTSRL